MKKLLLPALAVLLFPAYLCAAQSGIVYAKGISQIPAAAAARVPFEDKAALLKEMNLLRDAYLEVFGAKTLAAAFEEFGQKPSACEGAGADAVKCMTEALRQIRIPELFDLHKPQNYSDNYFYFLQLAEAKTEDEFLKLAAARGPQEDEKFTRLSAKYEAAFKAVSGVYTQFERSLPPTPAITGEQEEAVQAKHAASGPRSLTALELDLYKKSLVLSVIKANAPEILDYLKPYTSALFDSILTNSPQREKIARGAINSLLKTGRADLDKTIKETLAAFDKKIKG